MVVVETQKGKNLSCKEKGCLSEETRSLEKACTSEETCSLEENGSFEKNQGCEGKSCKDQSG